MASLLGIYLLMGVNIARSTEFMDRVLLLIKLPKHHPIDASYTKEVKFCFPIVSWTPLSFHVFIINNANS